MDFFLTILKVKKCSNNFPRTFVIGALQATKKGILEIVRTHFTDAHEKFPRDISLTRADHLGDRRQM